MFLLCDEQSRWLNEIQKSDWGAGQYLYELLRDHRLKEQTVSSWFLFVPMQNRTISVSRH